MQVGGGVSQNPQLHPKLSIARRTEQNPTSVSHPADTSSHKGKRNPLGGLEQQAGRCFHRPASDPLGKGRFLLGECRQKSAVRPTKM